MSPFRRSTAFARDMGKSPSKGRGGESALRTAPELCVEVLSPTNTPAEISEKVAAYLAAGAREVWVVGDDGVPEIHTNGGRGGASGLAFEIPRASPL